MIIFSVYDRKAELYGPIFAQENLAVAVRDFEQAVKMEDSKFGRWPEDFALHELGTWDPVTGEVLGSPERIVAQALDFMYKIPELSDAGGSQA